MGRGLRKLQRHSKSREIGFHESQKASGHGYTESQMERDFALLLDYDKDVVHFQTQPNPLTWIDTNKRGLRYTRRYTPDFLVVRTSETLPQLIEIKPSIRVDEDVIDLYHKAKRSALVNGYEFRLVTESDIYKESLIDNLRFLSRFKLCRFDSECWHRFNRSIPKSITILDLQKSLTEHGLPRYWAYCAIWRQLYSTNLAAECLLNGDTIIRGR